MVKFTPNKHYREEAINLVNYLSKILDDKKIDTSIKLYGSLRYSPESTKDIDIFLHTSDINLNEIEFEYIDDNNEKKIIKDYSLFLWEVKKEEQIQWIPEFGFKFISKDGWERTKREKRAFNNDEWLKIKSEDPSKKYIPSLYYSSNRREECVFLEKELKKLNFHFVASRAIPNGLVTDCYSNNQGNSIEVFWYKTKYIDVKNDLDKQYQKLLNNILYLGTNKNTRNGKTKSIFGYTIRHNMKDGFPLLTTKKMAWKTLVTELLWFLRGDTNIKYLVDNNCHIWDGDAFKNYLNTYKGNFEMDKEEFINAIKTNPEFAATYGELGPIYGKQWRNWTINLIDPHTMELVSPIDQITNLISELKTNPDSRRLMVSAWNVGELDQMVLPPCHYGFQVYTRELSAKERTALGSNGSTKLYDSIKEGNYSTIDADIEMHKVCDDKNIPKRAISLMWNQRSVDTFLGLPFNIASYGLLLEIIAKAVNMVPEELIGNLGDVHLYSNHLEQAKEQISRSSFKLPTLKMNPIFLANLEHKGLDEAINGQVNFELENYQSHPSIKAPLSN